MGGDGQHFTLAQSLSSFSLCFFLSPLLLVGVFSSMAAYIDIQAPSMHVTCVPHNY